MKKPWLCFTFRNRKRQFGNLDDLIKYENEHTGLDFKRSQYRKEQHGKLIKDIMSLVNADIESNWYIIIEVNHQAAGVGKIVSIKKEEFSDSAIYQQLIREGER